VKKKKDCSFFKTFAKKRTAALFLRLLPRKGLLFLMRDSFAEDRLHKKYKFVSLSHREHTKHEYTFLVFVRAPHF